MSTLEQARRYRARIKVGKETAGAVIRQCKHTLQTVAITLARRSERNANGCLLWQGSRNKFGYGQISLEGKLKKVHRVAWIIANGLIPEGMCVCHACDVRACIEPSHLWLGTYSDNATDAVKKGRNHKLGGWNVGRPHSEETRAKIAAKATERRRGPHTPESLAKMSQARAAWWARHKNQRLAV